MRILVIEDDQTMSKLVHRVLSDEGCVVDVAPSGEEGRNVARVHDYDGIVLDLELGDRDGVELLQELRRLGLTTPVLVFTGRDESASVVRALDAGADDYVVKPVPNDELRARVRALVRRGSGGRPTEQLSAGNMTLNRLTRRVRVAGAELVLTAKELALLEQLMLHAGDVVTRTDLLERVWEMHFDPDSNVVDVHIARLRRKLERAGASAVVVTRRGFGFVLSTTVPAD